MTSMSGTVHVVLRAAGAVTGRARGTRAPAEVRGETGGREKGQGLDNHSLRFTVGKQLSLPIRLSFMFSFGLFLVA